jgi:hypothetical protein
MDQDDDLTANAFDGGETAWRTEVPIDEIVVSSAEHQVLQ